MGKASRRKQQRKDTTVEDPEYQAAVAAHEARMLRRRWTLVCAPIVGGGFAAASWFILESESLTGVSALLGIGIFVLTLLDKLNDEIRPADGSRAASIDFGNSR